MLYFDLQHINLASLLGFCLDGEEKIVIFELVCNQSVDNFSLAIIYLNPVPCIWLNVTCSNSNVKGVELGIFSFMIFLAEKCNGWRFKS
ncbi:hypothetical protein RIF29_22799 [Crotalaria pallida]|uniref:Serine-threonine/tyrosine-protein kinase catalytic domain-containing protein n=1 Tax=Crotalaria pallida TaxID=3830 RepID=A0AAN9F4U8_CROPI